MINKYPMIKKGVRLHQGSIKNLISDINDPQKFCEVGKNETEIMKKCDGKSTINGILKSYQDKDKEDILNFIENNPYLIINDNPTDSYIDISGLKNIQIPEQIEIELTYNCNYKCDHCYNYENFDKQDNINKDKLFNFLKKMKKYGTRRLQLTGGEIFNHPNSYEILKFVFQNFEHVILLSNLSLISDKEINLISKYKDKLILQISINNGDNETYSKFINNSDYNLDLILNKIKKLTNNGVIIEITTVVHEKNINEVEDIINLTKNIGCKNISFSPIMKVGAALKNNFNNISLNELNKIIKSYKNYIKKPKVQIGSKKCELCNNAITITPTGNVKGCIIDMNNHFKLGNIFENEIYDIFSKLNNTKIFEINSPNKEECKDCNELEHCMNCIVKGLDKFKELGDKCVWGKKYYTYSIIK
ncbi:MAG: radical SAM protein [Methanobrevibacter sp.]|jgi:radical SAM protein with 4Fe4S-binding SPASM domain|nr:radical SAM protein [Methanobrevibacter sp.]